MTFSTTFDKGCMLVLGGAKSGKSNFALHVCDGLKGKRIFLATAEPLDPEMEERIRRHQGQRGDEWHTVEEPLYVAAAVQRLDREDAVVLLDCITLWISNLYMKYGENQEAVEQEVENLLNVLMRIRGTVVVVSNEIGMGIVPGDPLSRKYRDTVGSTNKRIALLARKVVAIFSGLPMVLKDE